MENNNGEIGILQERIKDLKVIDEINFKI